MVQLHCARPLHTAVPSFHRLACYTPPVNALKLQPAPGQSPQGDPAKLSQSLPALTELDLTSNLVASWDFVAQLCTALPKLAILNLSDNRLQVGHRTWCASVPVTRRTRGNGDGRSLCEGEGPACRDIRASRHPGSPVLSSYAFLPAVTPLPHLLPSQLPGSCPSPAALPGLRALVLNDCHVTWQQVGAARGRARLGVVRVQRDKTV